ncbi:MAG: DUF1015 domain-containing protein [Thermodesulfobacteriota bacterium]|nr:DUF1015 domain-containing protein [Thermodesulfobacteriota bacterium]
MATISPFQGIVYNQERIQHLKDVVTPPYDVISERERQAYFDRHPQNVVRLILSQDEPDDTEENNRYTRAARHFHAWLEEGILKQDSEPALYLTKMDFKSEGVLRTRLGFIALVELEDFGGAILPHEKTFSATRADRLRLIQTCKANFSPVFSLFSDPDEEIMGLLRSTAEEMEPDADFTEVIGYRHRLWRVTDPKIHQGVREKLAQKPLYIADGHHRYETALIYRRQMESQKGGPDARAPYNSVMMYLNSMQDPGLVMRSVHRMLCQVSRGAMDRFAEKAGAFFDVEAMDVGAHGQVGAPGPFLAEIRKGAGRGVMGAVVRGHRAGYVLRPKTGVMDQLHNGDIPGPLRKLDVTIATKLLLEKVLGFEEAALDDERRILYTSRTQKAFDAIRTGTCDVALILNPTKLSEVEETSQAGLIMPRKSTYFFPKVLSGLVMNKLSD